MGSSGSFRKGLFSLQRRQTIQGALAIAASTLLPGCGSASASSSSGSTGGGSSNSNPQPTPSGSITAASLSVTATAAGSIGSAFAGLSYEKSTLYENPYLFASTNTNLIALFKLLGPSILRIGGNSVDRNVWTPGGAGPAPYTSGSIVASTTPAIAAEEIAYVYQAFGSSLFGFEIGNECDLYG